MYTCDMYSYVKARASNVFLVVKYNVTHKKISFTITIQATFTHSYKIVQENVYTSWSICLSPIKISWMRFGDLCIHGIE